MFQLSTSISDRKSTRLNSSHTVISYAVFCLNYTSTASLSTLSLHDALPILVRVDTRQGGLPPLPDGDVRIVPGEVILLQRDHIGRPGLDEAADLGEVRAPEIDVPAQHLDLRSEEHTSELQSHSDLVCRLLLELYLHRLALYSFPTRRSSDLGKGRHAPGRPPAAARRRRPDRTRRGNPPAARPHRPAGSRRSGGPRRGPSARNRCSSSAPRSQIGRAHV